MVKRRLPPFSATAGRGVPSIGEHELPVGVPLPLVGATVAVKVTGSPTLLGLSEEARDVVVVLPAAPAQVTREFGGPGTSSPMG